MSCGFCLPFIFAGLHYDSFEAYTFKFTRDAEIELDSGIGVGLVEQIARGVKNRRKGEPVRLVYDKQMPRDMLRHSHETAYRPFRHERCRVAVSQHEGL